MKKWKDLILNKNIKWDKNINNMEMIKYNKRKYKKWILNIYYNKYINNGN